MTLNKPVHPGLADIAPGDVINKNSPIPLHYQLEQFLRNGIETGRFPPNSNLPTEHELQLYFDMSRTPVRQAISKLATDRLVERRRSLGTIVTPYPFDESLTALTSFTEEVQRKGQQPRTRVIEFQIRSADQEDLVRLNLEAGAQVYHVRRLRLINDKPVGLTVSRLPVALLPGLEAKTFTEAGEQQSTYNILERLYHLKLVQATEVIYATKIDEEVAELLDMPAQSAILMRDRVTYDNEQRAVAWERGLYHVRYRIEWTGRGVQAFQRNID
jgi:GntR family transcriptional regulator